MATVTAAVLAKLAGKPANENMESVASALALYGPRYGLDKPHRLAHYLAQLAHESGGFRYDREVWGPTAAQKRYDTRPDLGNTPEVDGDGKKYAGHGPIQITGKANTAAFRDWCTAQGLSPPDFVDDPELINTDPWEGLGPIWYWSTRNLNRYADANDIEQITKIINGGLNGFADRLNWYTRAALVLAGFAPADVRGFQLLAQFKGLLPEGPSQVDGDAGPKTRAALHLTLAALSAPNAAVAAAPVTETVEAPVLVSPKGADKTMTQRLIGAGGILAPIAGLFAGFNQTGVLIMVGIGIAATIILLWRGELIASRAKAVIKSFDGVEQK